MHEQTGELFLVREIDLESLTSSVLTLQVQVCIISYIACFHLNCTLNGQYYGV